jgi:hypothetical protein
MTKLVFLAVGLTLLPGLLSAETYYLTIAGLGGEADYEQRFQAQAKEIEKLVMASGKVTTLAGQDAKKTRIEQAVTEIAAAAQASDTFVLTLIGHGTFDGSAYKFNIPGSDMTAPELAAMVNKIPATKQLVVNMTSASGASLASLQKARRVVVTATKSGTEKNATIFGRYWVEALRDPGADSDKNESVSALEAFRYAERKTTEFYETQKRLATEHAVIEDTGKGEGVKAPSAANGQGIAAASLSVLRMGAVQLAANDPAKRKLIQQREDLEERIDKLKYEKAAMATDDYRRQLQTLLLQLAKTQEELDK